MTTPPPIPPPTPAPLSLLLLLLLASSASPFRPTRSTPPPPSPDSRSAPSASAASASSVVVVRPVPLSPGPSPAFAPLPSRLYSGGNDTPPPPSEGDDDYRFRPGGYKPETTSFGAEAVPEEQRPANEYLDLIRQPLFGWADEERGTGGLAFRLGAVYVVFASLVCYPIAGATFTQPGYLLNKLAATNVGALSVLLVVLVRLYSGWGYVASRLQSKTIEYEESGWYDGDVELKTESERARDLFLYRSDVRPVVDRLKVFTGGVAGLWLASCVGLNVVMGANPVFDQYDPEMLKTLRYDDKMASRAAERSGGRPSYCDSRYYRAVANGGQGCN